MAEPRRSRMKVVEPAALDMGVLPELMGYMLRQAQLLVYQDFHAAVADPHIRPPQFSIMEVLYRNPGIRPSDASAALGISRANLVPLLGELEGLGLVSRSEDKTDGRAQTLSLTPAGVAEIRRLQGLVMAHEERLAARLGPVGKEILLKLLRALVSGEVPMA